MRRWILPGLVTLLLAAPAARAAVLIDPYDNVLAPDGFYGLVYGSYSHAGELRGPSGEEVDADLTSLVTILRPIAYFHLGKVPLAAQLIVPFGKVEAEIEDFSVDESSSGLGDVAFGPGVFLYSNEKSATNVSYWFYAYAPTGEWDETQMINLGTNHWYFEHQLALNQIYKGFVLDVNLNYYHHNEEPDNDVQLPPRFETAVSLGYQLNEKALIGLHGGGYWDLDEWEVGGSTAPDTKARKIALGPTFTYQVTPKLGASVRWTHDFSAANDFVGNDVWLRASYAF